MGVAILRKWKKMHNTVDKRTHNDMRLTIATKPMISHELGDDPIIIAKQKRNISVVICDRYSVIFIQVMHIEYHKAVDVMMPYN